MSRLALSSPEVADAVVKQAKGGDMAAARLVLERIAPSPRHEGTPIKLDGFDPRDPERAADALLDAMANGVLSPERAHLVMDVLKARSEITLNQDIALRLSRVVQMIEERRNLPGYGAVAQALHIDLSKMPVGRLSNEKVIDRTTDSAESSAE